MNDMVERVARAILIARHPMTNPEDIWLDPSAVADARAAIEAMREPTKAMVTDARRYREERGHSLDCTVYWRRMINTALIDAAIKT